MTTKKNEEIIPDPSTAGKGFARTEECLIAPEDCGLPERGFGHTDFGEPDEAVIKDKSKPDYSTEGKGFARTEKCKICAEDAACPHRGFASTDFGENK